MYDDFSGGMNTRLSEFALPKSQGDIIENLRFDDEYQSLTKRGKTVVSCTTNASSNPVLGIHRFYMKDGSKITIANFKNTIVTCNDSTGVATTILTVAIADNRWDWLTWHDIAFGMDGVNQPVKYDGSSTSATYVGSALATDAGSGSGPNGSDYTWKISCYSSTLEYIFDQPSNEIDVSGNDVDLTMIPICPTTIGGESTTGRKVYRDKTSANDFFLLSNGTIANNTATTLTDSDTDAGLSATAYPAGDATVRPPIGRFGLIHKNRKWIANNGTNPSRLFYSEDGLHDYYLSDSFFNIRPNDGDQITFIKNWLGLMTVAKENTIQKMDTRGDDPDATWAITDPFSTDGCHAPYSAVNTTEGIMYLGNNGIYNFNGQFSELRSDAITPTIRDIQQSNFPNVWAEFFKNSYYMTYPSLSSGSSTNNRLLVVSLIDKAFSIDLLNLNVLHVFGSGSDVEALFSGSADNGKVFAHTETLKEILHKTHTDFPGTFNDMRFIPTTVGGDADNSVLELAWTNDIDTTNDFFWRGTIDSVTSSIIDRPDTDGVYTSDTITINATSLDKIYWNETIPSDGGTITFDVRSGATVTGISQAAWTTDFTNSSGSDISGATADTVFQYRINVTTDTITQTPTIFSDGSFAVRVTYNTGGTTDETTIPIRWRSGWLDYGYPGRVKELTKIYIYYDWQASTEGTLNLTFTGRGVGVYSEVLANQTETASFAIDLSVYPEYYIEAFPTGKMIGELIRLDITETSPDPITIKKIIIVYDVQEDLI